MKVRIFHSFYVCLLKMLVSRCPASRQVLQKTESTDIFPSMSATYLRKDAISHNLGKWCLHIFMITSHPKHAESIHRDAHSLGVDLASSQKVAT